MHGRQLLQGACINVTSWQQWTGPSRATAGPGETLSRGPITPPILYVLRSRRRKRREGGNVGRGVPSPSDQGPLFFQIGEIKMLLQKCAKTATDTAEHAEHRPRCGVSIRSCWRCITLAPMHGKTWLLVSRRNNSYDKARDAACNVAKFNHLIEVIIGLYAVFSSLGRLE